MLGLPMEKIRVDLGDSDLPEAPGSGGSFGANSAGGAVFDACTTLRQKMLEAAELPPEGADFADGFVKAKGKSVRLADLARRRTSEPTAPPIPAIRERIIASIPLALTSPKSA
jgi:xanthine dehydrogenase YagR molybdenum-binding subunit